MKVYVLLEGIEVDITGVRGVYATKTALIKAMLKDQVGVYHNAIYHWKKGEKLAKVFNGSNEIIYDNFESYFEEYVNLTLLNNCNGSIYEMELTDDS